MSPKGPVQRDQSPAGDDTTPTAETVDSETAYSMLPLMAKLRHGNARQCHCRRGVIRNRFALTIPYPWLERAVHLDNPAASNRTGTLMP